ncbi:MAG TPA: hypothetical protein VFR67_09860 [Pilimelia sp.]|nr:hypothetical protein [Pilimelia sp.]
MNAAESGHGGTTAARRVLSRHVAVLGGAAGAVAGARAGRAGAQRLGAVLAGSPPTGCAPSSPSRGLGDLVGGDRLAVLDALAGLVTGDGADVDGQATRDAMFDVLAELFPDAASWADLDAVRVDADCVRQLLELFLARYVYNRIPVIAERLARLTYRETLIDILVHGQDIAIPLRRSLHITPAAAAAAVTRMWTMRFPLPFPATRP